MPKKAKVSKEPSGKKSKASAAAGGGVDGLAAFASGQQNHEISNRSRIVGALLTFLASEDLMKAEAGLTPSIRERPSQLSIPSPSSANSFPAPLSSSMYRGRSPHAPQMQVLPTPYGAAYGFPGSFDFGYENGLPSPVNLGGMFPLSPMNRDAMNAAAQQGFFFGHGGNVMPQGQANQVQGYWGGPGGYAPIEGGAPFMKNKF
jgi:hypothetical protein